MSRKIFSLSIVSHGHRKFITSLIEDLAALDRSDFEVILTLNLPEDLGIDGGTLPFPITLIRNPVPKSFAQNHNKAFSVSHGEYFTLLNPDVRIINDPFESLLALLEKAPGSICAPLIVNGAGELEDNARKFPTPLFLIRKLASKIFKNKLISDFAPAENDVLQPDWIAGMFIVVPRTIYTHLHGLDERYRMYYEDVDFCAWAHLAGYKIMVNGHVKVIHEAQRTSHRNVRYMVWHLASILRFFTSKAFLKIQLNRLRGI